MGKKTDRIEELELELRANQALVRELARKLGVVTADVRPDNVVAITALFIDRISKLADKAPDEDDAAMSDGLTAGMSDRFLDREIDRANRISEPQAMVGRHVMNRHNFLSTQAAAEGQVNDVLDTVANTARELGLNVTGLPLSSALDAIHAEIVRVKNPGADIAGDSGNVSKGDSLAQAIEHNLANAQHLERELARNRAIVVRIAAAMQISQWDTEGTELIEKIQRWEAFKHVLSRRIRELQGEARADQSDPVPGPIARELESHLARLMAPREFARWLENKPKGTVSPVVAEIASVPPPTFDPFTMRHLGDMAAYLRGFRQLSDPQIDARTRAPGVPDSLPYVDETFWDLSQSGVAGGEFVSLMNLVILPLVARFRAATSPSLRGEAT